MSTGLGRTQRHALAVLAARATGVTTAELADLIGSRPRRTRAVVDSLVKRGLVVVVSDGGRRVWLPECLETHLAGQRRIERERSYVRWLLDGSPRNCPTCGQPTTKRLPPADPLSRWSA